MTRLKINSVPISKSIKMKTSFSLLGVMLLFISACNPAKPTTVDFMADNIATAVAQQKLQTELIEKSGKFINPRTLDKQGNIVYIPLDDWTSGFFPGSLWYTFKLTNDQKWIPLATKYTLSLDSVKNMKTSHDLGFMIGCSYLTGYRLNGNPEFKDVIIQTAKSLATRFRPNAGVIQSWDVDKDWMSTRGWKCPVIIDNMMNLELLFEATKMSGDSIFYKIAVSHANKTLENQFRNNNSCYHVVDYDPETGAVRSKQTAQGYSDESSWARGQAWGFYGYTVCYRYTNDIKYLEQAQKIYTFIFSNKNLPQDLIPYWDFNAPDIPNAPRDASSAAVIASALYELNTYLPNKKYNLTADKIMQSLSSPDYKAEIGENGNFILKHSVGSIPHNAEIDVPLNYADYYFLEALSRKQILMSNDKLTMATSTKK
jgi:rhamnogalacturonyl hydrolase YesR